MTDAGEILAAAGADRVLSELHGQADDEPWGPPAPLAARATVPTFPVASLAGWVGDYVAAVAEFTQTPEDLAGCIALAALSTAAGGHVLVTVRGLWTEPVNLFTVVAMPPGSRKSAVFRAMTAPLLAAETQLIERVQPQIIEAKQTRRIAEAQADKANKVAVNHATDEATAEAISASLAVNEITVPVLPRLVADDITTEQATSLLAEQGGRLAILSAEGSIFATLAGRYSSVPNLDVFLKGHAGDSLRVDRKTRDAEHIEHPALTLGLAVQPEVIRDIADMPGFRGKGLLGRILYALPASNIGYREIEPEPVHEHVSERYDTNLRDLVFALHEWQHEPARLQLSDDAYQLLTNQRRQTETRLRPDTGDLGHIGDWAGKYDGAVARIAGLLHLATNIEDGWRHPITADTMSAAITIGEYFATHALAAFDAMGTDPNHENALTIHTWLTKKHLERFTIRELFSGLPRGRFPKVADLDPALEILEQHGWIRRQPDPPKNGPGRRPSPTYTTHPHIHTPGAQPPSTTPE